jgi:hypothetical protein
VPDIKDFKFRPWEAYKAEFKLIPPEDLVTMRVFFKEEETRLLYKNYVNEVTDTFRKSGVVEKFMADVEKHIEEMPEDIDPVARMGAFEAVIEEYSEIEPGFNLLKPAAAVLENPDELESLIRELGHEGAMDPVRDAKGIPVDVSASRNIFFGDGLGIAATVLENELNRGAREAIGEQPAANYVENPAAKEELGTTTVMELLRRSPGELETVLGTAVYKKFTDNVKDETKKMVAAARNTAKNQPTTEMKEDYQKFKAETGSATAAFKELQKKYGDNNAALKHLKNASTTFGADNSGLIRMLNSNFGGPR